MQKLPVIAIVGRPNVGKSSLFNRLVSERAAVVDDVAGTTRDRNYRDTEWSGVKFTICDTGGLEPLTKKGMADHINKQVHMAIGEADAIIFLTDAITGLTDFDEHISKELRRKVAKKTVLAVNKSESRAGALEAHSFSKLGLGEPFAISAAHGRGVGDLLDAVIAIIRKDGKVYDLQDVKPLRIAVVGRPNAGKSSMVNKLLGDDRMIVDDVAGTTRDSIDTAAVFHGKPVVIVDTAGLRKKSHVKEDVEYYCNLRAIESIKRADICILVIDATLGIGEQDLRILAATIDNRKGVIVAWNKWDALEKTHRTFDEINKAVKHKYMELRHLPMLSTSALTGQRIPILLDKAFEIHERMTKRIVASELADAIFGWTRVNPHPIIGSAMHIRLLGVKQKPVRFPLFILFASNAEHALDSYGRYISNKIHDTYDFEGCPIIVEFRSVGRSKDVTRIRGGEDD